MADLFMLAELVIEAAPHLEADITGRLAWYKIHGNVAMGVQEFKELYANIE